MIISRFEALFYFSFPSLKSQSLIKKVQPFLAMEVFQAVELSMHFMAKLIALCHFLLFIGSAPAYEDALSEKRLQM